MLYQKPSFTVPASASNPSMCAEKGHSATDSRGCCFACGKKIKPSIAETSAAFASLHRSRDLSFVGAAPGSQAYLEGVCRAHGHMEPDRRGNCQRCGAKVIAS